MTNREFAKEDFFVKCCIEANVEATKRQASKFIRGFGLAYTIGKMNLKSKKEDLKDESR